MIRHVGLLAWALAVAAVAALGHARPALALDHCGQITSNETWTAADRPHIVTCDVIVRNSVLTLEAGTVVQLAEGANLIIGNGASLRAIGIPEATIRIAGAVRDQQPGFWGQIRFEPDSRESFFDYVEVIGGGRGGVPMIEVLGPGAQMFRMALRQTGGPPLAFRADAVGPSLARVLEVTVGRCGAIEMTQLGRREVLVHADAPIDITQETTWPGLCLPYRIDQDLTIGGPDLPTLGLSVGVTLTFASGAGLIAGVDAENGGQIATQGSIDEPVVLTGVESVPGSWRGVHLTAFGIGTFLVNTLIAYGGSEDRAMLVVDDTAAAAIDVRLRHAPGYPVSAVSSAVGQFFNGLDESKVAAPAIAQNGIDRAHVRAAELDVDIASNAQWAGIGVPYDIDGDLVVARQGGRATLTLGPGATLAFAPGAGLVVGHADHGAGSLRATGASTRRVVLTGQEETPGSWRGVHITEDAEESFLDLVDVAYGGSDGPMIRWDGPDGALLRARLRHALGYPMALPVANLDVVLSEALADATYRSTFADNGVDHILATGTSLFATREATWSHPGAPIEFEHDLVIASVNRPVVSWTGGLTLLFRPGKSLKVGETATLRGAVRVAASRHDERIVLGAADPADGWAGVRVAADSIAFDEDGAPGITVRDLAEDAVGIMADGSEVRLHGTELLSSNGSTDGLHATNGAQVTLSGPRIQGHRVGARASAGARFVLEQGWITDNVGYGALNEDPSTCQTASVIWWGDPDGPNDPSDAPDDCMDAANQSDGDQVSDDVDWANYAIDEDLTPVGGIVGGGKRVYLPFAAHAFADR